MKHKPPQASGVMTSVTTIIRVKSCSRAPPARGTPSCGDPATPPRPSLCQPATGQRQQALLPPILLCHLNSEARKCDKQSVSR